MGGPGSAGGAATLAGVTATLGGGAGAAQAGGSPIADAVDALATGESSASASVHEQADSLLRVLQGLAGGAPAAAAGGTDGVAGVLQGQNAAPAAPLIAAPLDQQLENLVSAMAAFSPPSAAQPALPQNHHDALNALLAPSQK
jgi:hypothetical protein